MGTLSLKNITLTIMLVFFTLTCSVIFADSSSENNNNNVSQSTTYTTTKSTTTNSSDDNIVSAIYAKYAKESALIGTALTVSSQNGIVSISGTVTAQSQADQASIAAKSVKGVKDVRSTINVITNPNLNKTATTPNY